MIGIGTSISIGKHVFGGVAKRGLQLWNKFNGDESDSSKTGLVATLYSGTAIDFTGVSSRGVEVGDVGAAKTIALSFSPDASLTTLSPVQRLIGFGTNPTYSGITLGNATGAFVGEVVSVVPDAANRSGAATPLTAGQWYRLVVSYNLANLEYDIYLDGVKVNTLSTGSHTYIEWDSLVLGGSSQSTNRFDGKMSNVQVWDTVWAAEDVTYDYANPNVTPRDIAEASST